MHTLHADILPRKHVDHVEMKTSALDFYPFRSRVTKFLSVDYEKCLFIALLLSCYNGLYSGSVHFQCLFADYKPQNFFNVRLYNLWFSSCETRIHHFIKILFGKGTVVWAKQVFTLLFQTLLSVSPHMSACTVCWLFFQPAAEMCLWPSDLLHSLIRNQCCDEIIKTTGGKVHLVTLSGQIASVFYVSITCLLKEQFWKGY